MRVVFTTVASVTSSPPNTKSLFTLGAYTPEASPLFKSGTAASDVHVLVAGLNFPNWLMLSAAEKEYPPPSYATVPSLSMNPP
jgi:hypothetical protein